MHAEYRKDMFSMFLSPFFHTTDMFAIPDYGSGATEHWGIITYRESRLLYTPGVSSQGNKVSSAAIIAHECAHLVNHNLFSIFCLILQTGG